MSDNRKPFIDIKRGEMSFFVAIVIGLILGALIKKVRLGLMLGLVIGIVIVSLNGLRSKR